jgi:hypothetical protein
VKESCCRGIRGPHEENDMERLIRSTRWLALVAVLLIGSAGMAWAEEDAGASEATPPVEATPPEESAETGEEAASSEETEEQQSEEGEESEK